jgi:hypothetical protein
VQMSVRDIVIQLLLIAVSCTLEVADVRDIVIQ